MYWIKKKPSLLDIDRMAVSFSLNEDFGNSISVSNGFIREELILLFKFEKIIGYCVYKVNGTICSIELIEILNDYRNKGLGKYLVKFLLKILKEKDVNEVGVFVYPVKNEKFWNKLGFKILNKKYDDKRLEMFINLD